MWVVKDEYGLEYMSSAKLENLKRTINRENRMSETKYTVLPLIMRSKK